MTLLVRKNRPYLPSFSDSFLGNNLMDDFFSKNDTLPAVNVKETEKDFCIEIALPGVDKKDVNIDVDSDLLVISMDKEIENETQEDNFLRREFGYTSFKRTFSIPESVSQEKINAKYKDGVLQIQLPKMEEKISKAPKQIKIS